MKRIVCTSVILLTLAGSASAGFDEGRAAIKRGDYTTALREIRPLAEQGDAESQAFYAYLYFNGWGVAQDDAEAARWYRRAAEQGLATSQYGIGFMHFNGRGVAKDYAEAARWYRKSAEQGYAKAQNSLGIMHEQGKHVERDYAMAARWYHMAAVQGNATAQFNLGSLYDRGRGVLKDKAEAARWFRKAADQGQATGQIILGLMYESGDGVARDHGEATRWYRKAAERGHAEAQYLVGGSYHIGRGVAQNFAEAMRWYRKAAAQGYGSAQNNLGVMYADGQGVVQDFAEAVRWFRMAAEQGNAMGQKHLGQMYRDGRGVKRDDVEAHMWLSLAASRLTDRKIREETIKTRDVVVNRLTPIQRSVAMRQVQNWRPRAGSALSSQDTGRYANASRTTARSRKFHPDTVSPLPARPNRHASRQAIASTQRALAELGFGPGPADGALGPKTRAAIVAFQKSRGLAVTGEPSEALRQTLRAANSARTTARNRYGIAVVIGNKTYKGRTPPVDFAHNDADAMKRFVIERLGYRPGNVIDLRDASKGELEDVFGTRETHKGKLSDWARGGRSDVVVFYSGHGVPGLEDKRGYLLPVDGNPNRARITGYPVDLLYANLTKIGAKSVTVYLDACFSGDSPRGLLVRAASGLSVTPRMPNAAPGLVVLTAASGDQFASWDEDAKHGLFTLHLLKGLWGAADKDAYGNGDGIVTLGEVKKYLDDEMSYQARRRFGRAQTVTMQGEAYLVLTTYAANRKP